MDHILTKDRSGKGHWILIVGCPWDLQHLLCDNETGIKGPSFALCAACEYQRGINLELRDADHEYSSEPFPERLQCGFNEDRSKSDRSKLQLVKR